MSKTRIALFDADIICFRSAAVSEKRSVVVTHIPSGKAKEFDTRTAFKDYLKSKDIPFEKEKYSFEDKQEEIDFNIACKITDALISDIQAKVWADESILYISGSNNFRNALALPTQYKGNRKDTIKPLLLSRIRKYVIKKYNAVVVDDHEVDDEVIIAGYEYQSKGYDVTIITNDKDSNAYSGLKLFDFTKEDAHEVLIPSFGSLYLDDKKKVRGNGFLWFCFQWINGDITDCFKPSELAGVKFGDMSAYKLLVDCCHESEALQVVIQQYKEWYPKKFTYMDWEGITRKATYKDMMKMYFKCCRMKTTRDDILDCTDMMIAHGIKF